MEIETFPLLNDINYSFTYLNDPHDEIVTKYNAVVISYYHCQHNKTTFGFIHSQKVDELLVHDSPKWRQPSSYLIRIHTGIKMTQLFLQSNSDRGSRDQVLFENQKQRLYYAECFQTKDKSTLRDYRTEPLWMK